MQLDEALRELGFTRVEAQVLAALCAGPATTRQVMERTGLRQPQVSTGMALLRQRGWAGTRPGPQAGKGRPMHDHHLVGSPTRIRRHCESLVREAHARQKAALRTVAHHFP